MTGSAAEFKRIYLKPAELCVSRVPTLVTTVLGSCVSVTMCHPKLGVAAICHALQSVCPKPPMACPRNCVKKYHYISCVIPEMLHHMEAMGASRETLEAKLFGGAAVLTIPAGQSIGRKNIETARSILEDFGVDVKSHQVGGSRGRKIVFNTFTGEVIIKKVRYTKTLQSTGVTLQGAGRWKR